MSSMEMFVICVGLGVLLAIGFVLKFFVAKWCKGKCSSCKKETQPQNYILSTNPRLHSRNPTRIQPDSDTHNSEYLDYLPIRSQNSQPRPHAFIRANPSRPGEAAMYLTFTFPSNENEEISEDAQLQEVLLNQQQKLQQNDLPPKYEELFPESSYDSAGRILKTIEEEETVV